MDEAVRGGQQAREDLRLELSLEDKISLLTGADYWFHLHIGRSSRDVPLPGAVTASSVTDRPGGTPGGSRC